MLKVHAQRRPGTDDFGLGHGNQRRLDRRSVLPSTPALVANLRQILEGLDELRAAVRIAGIVNCIDADEYVGGAKNLRPAQGEGQQQVLRAGT
jgi:hypothetical protein